MIVRWILSLIITLFATAAFAQIPVTIDKFPDALTLGDVQWKKGFDDQNTDVHIVEYVLDKETVKDWTQLVTFQLFKFTLKQGVTPEMFAESEMKQIKEDKRFDVNFKIMDKSDNEVFLEFKVNKPESEQQDELQRVIKTADDKLYVLHYVIKKSDMGDDARAKWTEVLKSIDLVTATKSSDTATDKTSPATDTTKASDTSDTAQPEKTNN